MDLQILPAPLYCHNYNRFTSIFRQSKTVVYGDSFFVKQAFDLGAEDFLRTPFSMEEMSIRLEKALRNTPLYYPWGELSYSGNVLHCQGKTLRIRGREHEILMEMIHRRGSVLSRQLYNDLYHRDRNRNSRTLDFHITSLRKKLSEILPEDVHPKDVIITVSNRGYLLA